MADATPQAPTPQEGADPAPTTEDDFEKAFAEFAGGSDAAGDTDPAPPEDGRAEDDNEGTPKPAAAAAAPKDKTETPPPQSEPAPAEADGAAPAADPSKADGAAPAADPSKADIWAKASPEHRDAYKAAQDELTKQTRLLCAEQGRTGAFQRKINELTRDVEAAKVQKPADAPKEPDQPIITDEKWKSFKEDYPELAEVLEPIRAELDSVKQDRDKMARELGGMSAAHRESFYDRNRSILAQRHPDWEDVTGSDAFGQWLAYQPGYVREAALRNGEDIVDPEEASHIVNLYKLERKPQPSPAPQTAPTPEPEKEGGKEPTQLADSRQRRLESAVSTPSQGPGAASGPPDDFEKAFEHFARKKRA